MAEAARHSFDADHSLHQEQTVSQLTEINAYPLSSLRREKRRDGALNAPGRDFRLSGGTGSVAAIELVSSEPRERSDGSCIFGRDAAGHEFNRAAEMLTAASDQQRQTQNCRLRRSRLGTYRAIP